MNAYDEIVALCKRIVPQPTYELHCHPAAWKALKAASPDVGSRLWDHFTTTGRPLGEILVYEHEDFAPGYWHLRKDGKIIGRGNVTIGWTYWEDGR